MQIKEQAPACVWYQPRKIKASPQGGIRSLLALKNITEVRVGMRTHVYLAKS